MTCAPGAQFPLEDADVYKLVLMTGDKEQLVMHSDKFLDVKLALERHVRSLAKGMMEIRPDQASQKDKPAKK